MNKPVTKATPTAAEAVLGHNKPPLVLHETLKADTADIEAALAQLEGIVEHPDTPQVVEDEDDLDKITKYIKKTIVARKRSEERRVEYKKPYLDAGRDVDSHFAGFDSRFAKCQNILQAPADRYLVKKEEAERKRRDAEAKAAREAAEDAAREAERKRQVAAAATEKACQEAAKAQDDERTRQAAKLAADAQADLLVATRTADTAANTASSAAAKASEAPKELARTVTTSGTASLKQNWNFEITQVAIIDCNILRPYLTIAHIEQAIRGYIRAGKHLVGGTETVLAGEDKQGGIPGVRIYSDKSGTYK